MNKNLARLISAERPAIDVLRLVLCGLLFTHGTYRYFDGTIPKLGEILESHGFPYGLILANMVNLAETGGVALLVMRLMLWPVCSVLILIYAVGIFLFHRHLGFFVVGPGSGGWEYSALIITCLAVIMWENRAHKLV